MKRTVSLSKARRSAEPSAKNFNLAIFWKPGIDFPYREVFKKVKNLDAALKIIRKRNRSNISMATYKGNVIA